MVESLVGAPSVNFSSCSTQMECLGVVTAMAECVFKNDYYTTLPHSDTVTCPTSSSLDTDVPTFSSSVWQASNETMCAQVHTSKIKHRGVQGYAEALLL